jgi:hypothetical protein
MSGYRTKNEEDLGTFVHGKGQGRMEAIRLTVFALHGPHPLLGQGRALIQKRRVLHQQDHVLRPSPLQRRVLMSRENLM